MSTLLRIDSSPMGETAISRQLTREFASKWLEANPGGSVIHRDLTAAPIPVIDAAWVAANYTPRESRTRDQNERLKLSTELIGELLRADEYVIGMPIHNWGPPASFKLWVDHIVTPSSAVERPLRGKRAAFVIAAGSVYAEGSKYASKNHVVPWLRMLFGGLGIEEMEFVFAEGSKAAIDGRIDRATFLAPHIARVHALSSQPWNTGQRNAASRERTA
jgi:FMN-dependent NADH-azoreductase